MELLYKIFILFFFKLIWLTYVVDNFVKMCYKNKHTTGEQLGVLAYLGPSLPSGKFSTILMSFSVQSPAERMCTLKKSSSGADVIVNGCHSSWEMAGQFKKTYCPTSILKPDFINCSSRTLDGCITILEYNWDRSTVIKEISTFTYDASALLRAYLFVIYSLNIADKAQQPLTYVNDHRTNHPHPSLEKDIRKWKLRSRNNIFLQESGTFHTCTYSICKQFPLPEEILLQTEEWDIQEYDPTSLDNFCRT